jgi:hypothetical protein
VHFHCRKMLHEVCLAALDFLQVPKWCADWHCRLQDSLERHVLDSCSLCW